MRLVLIAVLVVGLTGCAGFKLGGPAGEDPVIGLAGTIGVGCGAIPAAGKPQDVLTARAAVGCMTLLLGNGTAPIDVKALQACVSATKAPEKYRGFIDGLVVELHRRYGQGGVFPIESKAAEALRAFLATCGAALG